MNRTSDSATSPSTLRTLVERAASALLASSDDEVAARMAPGASPPKEILGHLIDAAAVTHQRVLWAQEHETLVLDGDLEDEARDNEEADWPSLVSLWWMYATHLLRTLESLPEAVRRRPHRPHTLTELAWRPVPADEPAALDDLLRDYEAHLRYHLAQLLPELVDDVPSPQENR